MGRVSQRGADLVARFTDHAFRIDRKPAAAMVIEDIVMMKVTMQQPARALRTAKLRKQSDCTVNQARRNRRIARPPVIIEFTTPILDAREVLRRELGAMERGNHITENGRRFIILAGDYEVRERSAGNCAFEQHGAAIMIEDLNGSVAAEVEQHRKGVGFIVVRIGKFYDDVIITAPAEGDATAWRLQNRSIEDDGPSSCQCSDGLLRIQLRRVPG